MQRYHIEDELSLVGSAKVHKRRPHKHVEDFKRLAITLHPQFIAYAVQKAPFSRPPIGPKLVFSTGDFHYVFLDFAHGATFRRTKLPVCSNERRDAYFKEKELENFIYTELNRKDPSIISFEILGGY